MPLKTSAKSKPTCLQPIVLLGAPSAPAPGQHACTPVAAGGERGQPTCQADALGAVAQVHHHADLRGERGCG